MIYTRLGAPVKILDAKIEEVEFDGENVDVWFCRAELKAPYPDGSGKAGEPFLDGEWFQAGQDLVADGGWSDIEDALRMVHYKRNGVWQRRDTGKDGGCPCGAPYPCHHIQS